MKTYKEFMECSVNRTIKLISGKWKPVILKQLSEGETRFVDIWRAIPKVSKKVLCEQLNQLERDSFVSRREYLQFPPMVSYELTDKGKSFLPIFKSMDEWCSIHLNG